MLDLDAITNEYNKDHNKKWPLFQIIRTEC